MARGIYDRDNPHASLTGGQIQEVLDTLMYTSLEHVIRASEAFDLQLAHLICVASTNRKRKVSALEREEFISQAVDAIMTEDVATKAELVAEARIARSFIYRFLMNFLKRCDGYAETYSKFLAARTQKERIALETRLLVIEHDVAADRAVLFNALPAAADFLEMAYEFRNRVVNNYVNLALGQARSFARTRAGTFDVDDLHQNLMTAVTRAIDKYDASKGALTSYLGYWILNALTTNNTEHGHEYGVAYTIPQVQRKSMAIKGAGADSNFSYSLNHSLDGEGEFSELLPAATNIQQEYEDAQENELIRRIVKAADIKGVGRLVLNIDEYHTAKERRLMRKTMREQGTDQLNQE